MKTIKAWAIVDKDAETLLFADIQPVNGPNGSALTKPWISTNRAYLSKDLGKSEAIVPCAITYESPT